MKHSCRFCNREMDQVEHTNSDIFDVYLCTGCIKPEYDTRYRLLFARDGTECLASTIRIDEYYIILNHNFHMQNIRHVSTTVHKHVDLKKDQRVFELDFILDLPLHDPALCKQKLQIYTTFS